MFADVVSNYLKNNEFLKIEPNRQAIDSSKKEFEDLLSKYKIRIPLVIIISNNGNRDTTITKASVDILGYKGKTIKINIDNLLKKVKANSTEKIELAGPTFGGDMRIPGDIFINSFYQPIANFGKNVLGEKVIDKYDYEIIGFMKNLLVKMLNDEVIDGKLTIKLIVEDQFGNREIEELNIESLPKNIY